MSLNRNEKAAVVTDVSAQAARSQTLALAEYRGLSVAHLDTLRRQARDKGVYLHVLKNTLARRAVVGAVAAAKVVADFAKTNDKLVIKGGAYAGKALDANGIKTLAAVPSKEVLLAQLLGLMQSPISRLARVVAAIAEKKAGPAVAEAEAPAAA